MKIIFITGDDIDKRIKVKDKISSSDIKKVGTFVLDARPDSTDIEDRRDLSCVHVGTISPIVKSFTKKRVALMPEKDDFKQAIKAISEGNYTKRQAFDFIASLKENIPPFFAMLLEDEVSFGIPIKVEFRAREFRDEGIIVKGQTTPSGANRIIVAHEDEPNI